MSKYAPDKTILIDFDGCLTPFVWPGPPGEPFPGAKKTLAELQHRGFYIVIFTARRWKGWADVPNAPTSDEQTGVVKTWLDEYQIPYDEISNFKRPARWYLDDRAMRVTGPEWMDPEFVDKLTRDEDHYGKIR